jgi:hypothetical protein
MGLRLAGKVLRKHKVAGINKTTLIYRRNHRAVQLLLGHTGLVADGQFSTGRATVFKGLLKPNGADIRN